MPCVDEVEDQNRRLRKRRRDIETVASSASLSDRQRDGTPSGREYHQKASSCRSASERRSAGARGIDCKAWSDPWEKGALPRARASSSSPPLSCLPAAICRARYTIRDKTVAFMCHFDDIRSLLKRIGHLAWLSRQRSPTHTRVGSHRD